MNPSTALATVIVDELARCGLAEAVIAPGSRSTPLAMALWRQAGDGPGPAGAAEDGAARRYGNALRLHVRLDERSAAYLALGLAKASGRPVAVVCTSGTAAAHLHAAVIEADESGVPLLLLTADRPPELRGTGANQTIDQIKLYGTAVRWFCEVGVAQAQAGMNAYWRSLACRAWAAACGGAGAYPGPVHLNLAFGDPLVPDTPGASGQVWPEPLEGRVAGAPWTRLPPALAAPAAVAPEPALTLTPEPAPDPAPAPTAGPVPTPRPGSGPVLELPWTERAVIVCGDGCGDPAPLLGLAREAGWPVLAEPSSGARTGHPALSAYPYLLESPEFVAAHRPDLIISAGRPGLSRAQLAYLKSPSPSGSRPRHVVIARGAGRWDDPGRSVTDVAGAIRVGAPGAGVGSTGKAPAESPPGASPWLESWLAADAAARRAADDILDAGTGPSEPRLARDLAAALPGGALLWAASSLPIRDLDQHMVPRPGVRVLASRGASGIDGLVSSAMGAALAHQRAGGGPAVALLGDLAFLHDAPGLFLGPDEPRPDLAIVVVNNNGGGIFSMLEQARFPESFERLFGTPHGAGMGALASAAGIPVREVADAAGLVSALSGGGLRVIEVRTDRSDGMALRQRLRLSCAAAAAAAAAAGDGSRQ